MNTVTYKVILLILLSAGAISAPKAETLQSLDNIEHAAYEYGLSKAQSQYDNPQIVMTALDSRLRLQACDSKLEAFSNTQNSGLGNQTIGVKCHRPVAWTVYVPIQVKVFQPVVVVVKSLPARHEITKADIRIEQHDISILRQGYLQNTKMVIGQQLKYSVARGTVIKPRSLVDKKVIHRGEQIVLIATAGNMEVRMTGKALSDATQGQRIRVKNLSSKRIVEGIVDAPGIVRITM